MKRLEEQPQKQRLLIILVFYLLDVENEKTMAHFPLGINRRLRLFLFMLLVDNLFIAGHLIRPFKSCDHFIEFVSMTIIVNHYSNVR